MEFRERRLTLAACSVFENDRTQFLPSLVAVPDWVRGRESKPALLSHLYTLAACIRVSSQSAARTESGMITQTIASAYVPP